MGFSITFQNIKNTIFQHTKQTASYAKKTCSCLAKKVADYSFWLFQFSKLFLPERAVHLIESSFFQVRIAQMNQQVRDLKKKNTQELEKLRNRNSDIQLEINEINQSKLNLENQRDAISQQSQKIEEDNNKLRGKLLKINAKNKNKKKDLESKKDELATLKRQLADFKSRQAN